MTAPNGAIARLERVLGCTACSRSLAVDPQSGVVAYPAGSALVLANPRSQCRLSLLSPAKCQLTCLAWSPCGQFIASGEFGTDPKVRVWAVRKCGGGGDGSKAEPECELGWHKLGISCVAFSPDSSLLLSVGNNHDKQILVWDWRTGRRLAESRLTCQVNAMAQAESGKMFVTVGVRHVKFWYVERQQPAEEEAANGGGGGGGILLQGRSAILAEQRNNTFIDCCCAPGQRTFALTLSRLLVEFVDKRLVSLYQMGGEVPYALAPGPGLLFIGFGDGAIRALDSTRMEPLAEFGRPHALHADLGENGEEGENGGGQGQRKFPDVHAIAFHAASGVLTALYSDRSIYHWLLNAPPSSSSSPHSSASSALGLPIQPIRLSSQLFHVGPIFDLEPGPGGSSFFTAGADETVRMWSLSRRPMDESSQNPLGQSPNAFSPELRKILFLSPELDSLTERPDKNFGGIISDTLESTTGARCVRLSPGGKHLACGRKNGNICVFDLRTKEWPRLVEFEAHDGEVLCLEYGGGNGLDGDDADLGDLSLLASGSRDRLVHLFDAARQYAHLMTLDEHRGPVIGLKLMHTTHSPHSAADSPSNPLAPFVLISFGTDQLVLSRQIQWSPDGTPSIGSIHSIGQNDELGQVPPVAMAATPSAQSNHSTAPPMLLIAFQDRALRQFDALSGELVQTFAGAGCEEGARITKLCLDPSGTFAATLCSDRTVRLLDLENGANCVAVLGLPSDCITGLAFSADCRRLLLVSYSGCISVWRLCTQLHRRLVAKLAAETTKTLGTENNENNQRFPLSTNPADRPISPESAIIDDSSIFGSLASNLDTLTGGGIQSPIAIQQLAFYGRKEEEKGIGGDDELDSGIGGGGSGGPQKRQQQRFELKRLLPSEGQFHLQEQQEGGALANQGGEGDVELKQRGLEEEDVVPSMLSPSPSPSIAASRHSRHHHHHHHHAAPPPPYHQHFQGGMPPSSNGGPAFNSPQHLMPPNIYGGQNGGTTAAMAIGTRSMSNLHGASGGSGGGGGGRRRWNVPPSPTPNQVVENVPPMMIANNGLGSQNAGSPHFNGTFANANQQIHPQHFHQNQPHPLPHPTYQSPFSPPPLNINNNLGGISPQDGQRFGISTSVSLSAIRGKLATESEGGQQQPPSSFSAALPPTNGCWSSSPNRNSLTRRFLQNGHQPQNNNVDHQNCVWSPSATILGTKNANLASARRRASNLFNSSPNAPNSIAATLSMGGQHHLMGIPLASGSPGSSQASTPSVPSATGPSPSFADGQQNNSSMQRRLFHQQQENNASNGEKGGGGGARLALTRIRQRRAGGLESSATPFGGQNAETPPSLLRSRSQSPSQLALALLAQSPASTSANAPPTNSQHRLHARSKALSPSARSAISSTSSPSSCPTTQQNRASASRLQEARQRLKKSQENLLAALHDDEEGGEGEEEAFGSTFGGAGGFGRSRSIGNLRLASTRGPDLMEGSSALSSHHQNFHQRQMAKSVTDLAAVDQERENAGEGQNRLAECRQRLAQSIRDIRRISESDLLEPTAPSSTLPSNIGPMVADSSWQTPSSSAAIGAGGLRGGPRRGVQKKLDRQWPGRGQTDLIGDAAIESNGGAANSLRQSSMTTSATTATNASNPPHSFFHALNSSNALRKDSPAAALRSATTLVPSNVVSIGAAGRSPRSNYLAQKLAAGRDALDSSLASQAENAGSGPGCRSLSAELGLASAALTNNAAFTSTSSKRMAMHAQECIREMQQACDKLLGTRQLIRMEPSISQEEKRQMLASVNRAVAAFAQRLLAMDEDGQNEGGQLGQI